MKRTKMVVESHDDPNALRFKDLEGESNVWFFDADNDLCVSTACGGYVWFDKETAFCRYIEEPSEENKRHRITVIKNVKILTHVEES